MTDMPMTSHRRHHILNFLSENYDCYRWGYDITFELRIIITQKNVLRIDVRLLFFSLHKYLIKHRVANVQRRRLRNTVLLLYAMRSLYYDIVLSVCPVGSTREPQHGLGRHLLWKLCGSARSQNRTSDILRAVKIKS